MAPERPPPTSIFRHRPFALYLTGTVLSRIGSEGTFVAVLYHMYLLSGSTLQVGLIGLSRGAATIVFAPLAGYYADRLERRRLLQACQAISLVASLLLSMLAITGAIRPWHLVTAIFAQGAASIFDNPSRKAIIPAVVPPSLLVKGFAVINPSAQVGKLAGPALAGVLIAIGGPQSMYVVDALTFAALIVVLALLDIPRLPRVERPSGMWSSILEGASFMRRHPVLLQLIGLDVSAMFFTAFRVVLPAIALEVLHVGAAGYGILSAGPAVGALLGGAVSYRLAGMSAPSGWLALSGTALMGLSAMALALARSLPTALLLVALFGFGDAMATVIRQAALLVETPDRLRGRVSALYGMAGQGGPSLGQLNVGWLAGMFGITGALLVGGAVPVACAIATAVLASTVREYRGAPPPVAPVRSDGDETLHLVADE